jgi:hypothetical protein
MDPVRTEERWNLARGRPNRRDHAAKKDAPFTYLNKSPLDSSPRSSAQKKSCCQGKKVVHRPRLDKSPLDSSPRSSEQRQSQKMLFFCFQSRCTATYGPKVEQPEFLLAQKAVPKTDDSRRTWLILLIHIDRRPNYLHIHSEIIGMTAQSGASATVDRAQKDTAIF